MNRPRQSRLALTSIVVALIGGTISCQTWELARVITVDSPIPQLSPQRAPSPNETQLAIDDSAVMPAAFTESAPAPQPQPVQESAVLPALAPEMTPVVGSPAPAESSPFRPKPVQIHAISAYEVDRRPSEPSAVRPAGMQDEGQPEATIPRRRPMPPLKPAPPPAFQPQPAPGEGSPTPSPQAPPRAQVPSLEPIPAPRPTAPPTAPSSAGAPQVIPFSGWLPAGNEKGIGRVKPISDLTIATDPPEEFSPEGEPLDVPADLAAEALAHVPPYDRGNIVGAPWSGASIAPFGFCYQPLYFEEAWLERYGYSYGVWQPAVSAGRFYGNIALMPVKSILNPPRRCTNQVYPTLPGTYGLSH